MYGFPPLKNSNAEIKEINKQRSFSNKTQTFINIRQIINSKKNNSLNNANNQEQLDIVTNM